jgi:hypothetical protein
MQTHSPRVFGPASLFLYCGWLSLILHFLKIVINFVVKYRIYVKIKPIINPLPRNIHAADIGSQSQKRVPWRLVAHCLSRPILETVNRAK